MKRWFLDRSSRRNPPPVVITSNDKRDKPSSLILTSSLSFTVILVSVRLGTTSSITALVFICRLVCIVLAICFDSVAVLPLVTLYSATSGCDLFLTTVTAMANAGGSVVYVYPPSFIPGPSLPSSPSGGVSFFPKLCS